MARDMSLIRELLSKLDAMTNVPEVYTVYPRDVAMEGRSESEILDHLWQIRDMGLIEHFETQPASGITYSRLSPQGHDLLAELSPQDPTSDPADQRPPADLVASGDGPLPPDGIAAFKSLVDIEMENLDDQVRVAIDLCARQAAKNGMLQSGNTMAAVCTAITNSLPARSQVTLTLMARTLSTYKISLNDDSRRWVGELIRNYILHRFEILLAIMKSSPPFKQADQRAIQVLEGRLNNHFQIEFNRVDAELTLLSAAAARSADQGAGQGGYHFHAPVALVQTGAQSTGTAHQHIDQGSLRELSAALDKVLDLLSSEKGAVADENDVHEMATEAKQEIEKAKPNVGRLKAMVRGVGEAIKWAPRLQAAYEVLKGPASAAGIHLP